MSAVENPGQLIAVVGPSGVGKDSVMAGLLAARPDITRVCRVITRAPGLGGEDYDAVTPEQFETMAARGAFCVHWSAHGLRYGLPAAVLDAVRGGNTYLANFSRSALSEAAALFPSFIVLNITAAPDVLAARLADRGRESAQDIEKRLAQAAKPLPEGLDIVTIENNGTLDEAVTAAISALQPVRG